MFQHFPHFRKGLALLTVLLVTGVSPASAAEAWYSSNVSTIYPLADGSFILILATSNAACLSAESPKRYLVSPGVFGMTAEGAKKIYAAAMFAMALGKQLTVVFDAADTACSINRASVSD